MPESANCNSLGRLFLSTASRYPDRPALVVGEESYSYRSLLARSLSLAQLICQVDRADVALCAVYGNRSIAVYSGILGTLLAGRRYVPVDSAAIFPQRAPITNPSSNELLAKRFAP